MLHLYYGKDTQDAYAFFFALIHEKMRTPGPGGVPEPCYILCPDQFTHTAELAVMEALGGRGMMDVEVLSFSRLGHKILEETGGAVRVPISGNGRRMLLSKILAEHEKDFSAFGRMSRSVGFAEKLDSVLSEFKQYGTSPEDVKRLAEDPETSPFLKRKLADLSLVYEEYAEAISGHYLDTEDYMAFFSEQAKSASLIHDGTFYLLDFDPFSPSVANLFASLVMSAKDVHLALTPCDPESDEDLYSLMNSFRLREQKRAEKLGVPWDEQPFPERKEAAKTPRIVLAKTGTVYQETETAAAEILRLVRDEQYRFRDIAVLCNDMEERGRLAGRIFRKYGIPVFMDEKKKMVSNPACVYLLALLDTSVYGRRPEDVFRLLKTGFSDLTTDEIEYLENYAIAYKTIGKRWNSPFVYGVKNPAYGEEGLKKLNEIREKVAALLNAFDGAFDKAETAAEKTRALYAFLTETARLPEKQDALRTYYLETDAEQAEEIRQVWDFIVSVLDQIVALAGEEVLSGEDFRVLLAAGLSAGEIGMIPPTSDRVLIGPARRLATQDLGALFILGASDGILPDTGNGQDLLSRTERAELLGREESFCRDTGWKRDEELIAIDKALRKPTELLWISTAQMNSAGEKETPSELFAQMEKRFPNAEHRGGLKEDSPLDALMSVKGGVSHLANRMASLKNKSENERKDENEEAVNAWKEAYDWYAENAEELLAPVREGLLFRPGTDSLKKERTKALYGDSFSASALEKYSRCPFSYFVKNGLRPEEQETFETDKASAGTLYHNALMEFSKLSPWDLSVKDVERVAGEIFEKESKLHREGILYTGGEETYRMDRLRQVFVRAAKALVAQYQSGHVQKTLVEEEFGRRGQNIPAIPVETEQGTVYIEGRIDRVDYLDDDYVKIIDYKSGRDTFAPDEARCGWRLQLMLYLSASLSQGAAKPGAVFYFRIADDEIEADKIAAELGKTFAMRGVVANEGSVWNSLCDETKENALEIGEIVSGVQRKKDDGSYYNKGHVILEPEDFRALVNEVTDKLKDLCGQILAGDISVRPMQYGANSACTYCNYRSICVFEPALSAETR